MTDWQQRVVDEKAELAGRIERLDRFTDSAAFQDLRGVEKNLLLYQLRIMERLASILTARIALFTPGASIIQDAAPPP